MDPMFDLQISLMNILFITKLKMWSRIDKVPSMSLRNTATAQIQSDFSLLLFVFKIPKEI